MKKLTAVVALALSMGLTGGVVTATAAHAVTAAGAVDCGKYHREADTLRRQAADDRKKAKRAASEGDAEIAHYYANRAKKRENEAKLAEKRFRECVEKRNG